MINPLMDGMDHININYSAKTQLGKFLSGTSYSPIATEDGMFYSVLGYWYWLITGKKSNEIKKMYGVGVLEYGNLLLKTLGVREVPDLKDKIQRAIKTKINTNTKYRELLLYNTLPLKMYSTEGTLGQEFAKETSQYQWVVDYIEKYRKINLIVEEING